MEYIRRKWELEAPVVDNNVPSQCLVVPVSEVGGKVGRMVKVTIEELLPKLDDGYRWDGEGIICGKYGRWECLCLLDGQPDTATIRVLENDPGPGATVQSVVPYQVLKGFRAAGLIP